MRPGLTIGAGQVFPEIKLHPPSHEYRAETWPDVVAHYDEMAAQILRRQSRSAVPVFCWSSSYSAMTEFPRGAQRITTVLKRHLIACTKSTTCLAPARNPHDIRDQQKPPLMRTGEPWQRLSGSLELCAAAGADILSIESIGGKELMTALMYGDFKVSSLP